MPDVWFQQLFEGSPTATVLVDRNGQVADSNLAAAALFGRSRGEIDATPVLQWIALEDRAPSKGQFLRALEGRTAEWQAGIARGDGKVRRCVLRAVPLTAVEGAGGQLALYVRETPVEPAGRPDVAQLQTVLETLPGQFVAVLDTEGRIRYANGVVRTLWYDDESRIGREFASLLDAGGDSQHLFEALRREVEAGRRWDGMLWLVRADGVQIPARIAAVPYRLPRVQGVQGTLLVGRDVKEELDARDALARAERLSRIGELVVSIGQELKKPVARLNALGVRLCERAQGESGPEWQLAAEVSRVERLVGSLLAFARGVQLERSAVDIGALLAEVAAEQRALFDQGGIRLATDFAADLPAVRADAGQLRLVFRHLLANAREAFGGERGEVRASVAAGAAGVVVQVRDNAAPRGEEWLERGFEPFFTTKHEHLGLGLALARAVVGEQGGRIWAERGAGEGSTLTIELPLEPPASTVAFRPVPLVLCRSRRVLIVDDDVAVRGMTRKLLEKVGYEVSEAWSGRSALARITSGEAPELVITDLKMKDGTGYWFLGQLSRDFPALLARTVIITGDPSLSAVELLAAETGCPVVRKPFEFPQLLEALDEVALRG
jgi:two-component system NtrC family sensor kinase